MSSLLNLLLEQRLLLALRGFALLLLVGSVALWLITELRARARRRQRQREREEREARLAEQEEARAVDEAVDDALATVVPVASALPVTDAVPAVEAPAAAAETPGTEGAAAVPADAAPATDAPPAPAGESAPKPKIAVNLFAGKPDEAKPPTVEQVKAEAPKPDASKGAGGGDGAFGELFSGVFDDEAAARMQMMLSGSEPVTMEALAELSQRVANSLNGADSTAEPAKDGDAQ